jgi:hypothetical protein
VVLERVRAESTEDNRAAPSSADCQERLPGGLGLLLGFSGRFLL